MVEEQHVATMQNCKIRSTAVALVRKATALDPVWHREGVPINKDDAHAHVLQTYTETRQHHTLHGIALGLTTSNTEEVFDHYYRTETQCGVIAAGGLTKWELM